MRIRSDIFVPHTPGRGYAYTITFKEKTYRAVIYRCHVEILNYTNRTILVMILGRNWLPILKKAYGYMPGEGSWPLYREYDFGAVARVFTEFEKRGAIITHV